MSDREDDAAPPAAGADTAPPPAAPAPDAAASIGRVGLEILSSLDPLDPRAVALDVFEVYCHEQLATDDVGRRAFLIKKMKVRFSFSVPSRAPPGDGCMRSSVGWFTR